MVRFNLSVMKENLLEAQLVAPTKKQQELRMLTGR
jgi:hypothetical protein